MCEYCENDILKTDGCILMKLCTVVNLNLRKNKLDIGVTV